MNIRFILIVSASLLSTKLAWATGYSGLNNELMAIYALVVGLCIIVIVLPKAIKYSRSRFSRKSSKTDIQNTE